ncbi:Uncharacterized protein HZ326_10527 [Fusarium oxysporum f. sp. albedinis]|nr:Uncharacterized protein HZ326_10527 [Fusarium oxysporum f. sp. albedinis]
MTEAAHHPSPSPVSVDCGAKTPRRLVPCSPMSVSIWGSGVAETGQIFWGRHRSKVCPSLAKRSKSLLPWVQYFYVSTRLHTMKPGVYTTWGKPGKSGYISGL